MNTIQSIVYLTNPLFHCMEFGHDYELPFHGIEDVDGKACCSWGEYCFDLLHTAKREKFPESLIDWKKAESLWRNKSARGFEGFMLSADKEYRMAVEYRIADDLRDSREGKS